MNRADGWVTENYLYLEFVATGYDFSPSGACGCSHTNFGSLIVTGPIEFDNTQPFESVFDVWNQIDFSEGTYNYSSYLEIYCSCYQGFNYAFGSPGAVQAQSPTCGDERDNIIQEYRNYASSGLTFVPSCNQFTQSRSSQYFQFSELNKGDYSWALIRQPLIIGSWSGFGLDKWRENYGAPRILNSAYRNPSRHFNLPDCAPNCAANSRHMYGDAADMRNGTQSQQEWLEMQQAAEAAFPSYIEPTNGPCQLGCVHADWRYVAGGYY